MASRFLSISQEEAGGRRLLWATPSTHRTGGWVRAGAPAVGPAHRNPDIVLQSAAGDRRGRQRLSRPGRSPPSGRTAGSRRRAGGGARARPARVPRSIMRERSADGGSYREPNSASSTVGISYVSRCRAGSPGPA
jgi:hypothetical protein